jgi:hypothetical protein
LKNTRRRCPNRTLLRPTSLTRSATPRYLKSGRCPCRELLGVASEARLRALQAEDGALLGLTAQRGWARLNLGGYYYLVLSPGDPTAATRELDCSSHEHHTVFLRDTGAAPLSLLASAGGVAATSKRPFLLSGQGFLFTGINKSLCLKLDLLLSISSEPVDLI